MKNIRKLTPSFILKGASHLYHREQKLYQSSTLPAFPGTRTQACHSWLFLQHRLIEEGRFGIHYLPGGLAKKLSSSEGWERDPDFFRKNEPSLSEQRMQGNQPLHNTHSWNSRCQMINCFISPSSFKNYFSWDVYFNPQVISRLFPNMTRNN